MRAGGVLLASTSFIESYLESIFFKNFGLLKTFLLKVLLSICYLRPSDEGVSIERGRQVGIEEEEKIDFFPGSTYFYFESY